MIANKDRSYYIGASDVSYVVGNWNTKSFAKWFGTKTGFYSMDFTNAAMLAGTFIEHRILDYLNIPGLKKDQQFIQNRLRVNLDGNTTDTIYEVKTYKFKNEFKVPLKYKQQVWVQMYATGIRNAYIIAYGLEEADYDNFYRDISPERLSWHLIEYNPIFVEQEFLPKLSYLSKCLDDGMFPNTEYYQRMVVGRV